jgi:hypothetical protein
MRITEYRNPFDLSETVVLDVEASTIQEWVDRHPYPYAIGVVSVNGKLWAQSDWGSVLPEGADIRVMLKPGDPATVWYWVQVALVAYSVVTAILTPRPKVGNDDERSTAFSIGAQQNAAKLGMPIPIHYGRHRIWPDLLTQPFQTYNNNDQYVYQLFCLGAGEFEHEDLKIEDTNVSSFEEITYEYYYNQPVTLFPTDVVSSAEPASQELSTSFTGPFVASASNTQANRLEIDLVWEAGLFYARSSGDTDPATTTILAEYREIDAAGAPLGAWTTLVEETFTDTRRSPLRITRGLDVMPGRYEVRVRRGETQNNGPKVFNRCVWEGLRAYLEDDAKTYTGLTVLAVRARATGNLNSNSARRFNEVATRKLPVLDSAGEWTSPVATTSIGWALADIIRAEYGADRADAYIDLDKIVELNAIWETRGDEFNYRFDTTLTLWESLKVAARAGRAYPIMNGQVISFVRTAPQTIPVTIFNRSNTRNFRVEYSLLGEEENDSVMAEFVDPDNGWKVNQVLCQPPGSAGLNPRRVQYLGVTDRTQAFREGIYDAEAMRKQRKQARFETELEGYIPNRGDLVVVANEDFQYSQGGELTAVSGLLLTTSEPLIWDSGAGYAIRLRKPDGSVSGPHIVTPGPEDNQALLASPLGWTPVTGGDQVRTLYQFGRIGETLVEWLVREVNPRGGYVVEMVCVNEVDSVHTVDEADPPDSIIPAPIAGNADGPIIRTLLVEYTSNPAVLYIAWSAAPGAEYYVVERRVMVDSSGWAPWIQWTTLTGTQIEMAAPAGALELRVAGIGKAKGPWKTWSGIVGQYVIQSPTGLNLTSDLVLSSDGQYHAEITFTFVAPENDYHIKTFEAQYKYPRHDEWQPLFNALEISHKFTTVALGTIHVRVRSVYVQDDIHSDWAEASIVNLGTYDAISSVGLNPPVDPLLFVTLDRQNRRADIRVSVGYNPDDAASPEKFLLFYALDDVPNQLRISTDAGNKLYLGSVNIEGTFDLTVISGSTTDSVKYTDPQDLVDIDLSGMWWFRVISGVSGSTRFFKVSKVDTSTLYINPADPLPFTPQAGDTIRVIEVSYHDSRLPEFSLAYIQDPNDPTAAGEVIRHGGVNNDGNYYVDVEERGAEGTTQASATGKILNYFPAFGADTQIAEVNMEEFIEQDGQLTFTGNVPVRIPSNFSWASVSCCFVRRGTEGERVAWVRSHIVELTIGGPA